MKTLLLTNHYEGAALDILKDAVNGDFSLVCECRTADVGTGHLCHHGCQYRNDADGVDHVGGYVVRYKYCVVCRLLPGYYPYLHEESPLYW